jgi:hypothetical protein
MDIIDILGGMLRQKAGRSGKGPDILNDILRGGPRGRSQSSPATPREANPQDVSRQAKELEDLLNVAHDRNAQRTDRSTGLERTDRGSEASIGHDRASPPSREPADRSGQLQQALILVRAMVNAAKCDGQITPIEQQSIFEHVNSTSPETMQFLREEFAKPLDIREFALSVPLGMEQDVYTISLIAIQVDSRREADYLNELAKYLRLPANVRNQIHTRLGVPTI